MDFAERLEERAQEKGFNAYSLAKAACLTEDTVRDIIRGKVKDPGASKLAKIARVLGTTVEELLGAEVLGVVPEVPDDPSPGEPGTGAVVPLGRVRDGEIVLPVRFRAAAGAWREMDDLEQVTRRKFTAVFLPEYASFPQWLEEVEGDSVNKRLPSGALVHVVDTIAMGYEPASGDLVVVMRTRAGGLLRERSIKEVEITRDGVRLWPRSFNERWREPLVLKPGGPEEDDVTVEIVGKVVRAYIGF